MKVLELFAGTRSIGKAFETKGHEVFSVEWDKNFENIDLYADIGTLTAEEIIQNFGRPDIIWASPDCSTFSIAAISHHRRRNPETGNLDPVSDYAKFCDEVDKHVLELIKELKPTFYFIENPRGGMRKMEWMQGLPLYTVTYCQYGDSRMKPTDIWTNHPEPQFKPMCKNGDPCHEKAPRGSKTGTQGLKGSKERSVIPDALCQHIVDICEKYIKQEKENEMELRIEKITFPEVIDFNFEELKQEITNRVAMYANMVYTEDQVKQAKTDRANLNKFVKALSDERIKVKKQCMKPYEEFEAKVNELSKIVQEPISLIDKQVKEYEEQKKQKKLDEITDFFNSSEHPEWLHISQIMNEKWLNSSVSMKSIQEEINARLEQIKNDVATLSNLPEFGFEAIEVYKYTLDINKALNEGRRLSEIQKRKAEQEAEQARLKAEAELKKAEPQPQPAVEGFIHPPVEEAPAKQWVSFSALLSTEDALALKAFFESRNIQFEAIGFTEQEIYLVSKVFQNYYCMGIGEIAKEDETAKNLFKKIGM